MGVIEATHAAKSGHPGGSLSAVDALTYLYFKEMQIDPENPQDPERDRFVLSKGHAAPGLYATLAEREASSLWKTWPRCAVTAATWRGTPT